MVHSRILAKSFLDILGTSNAQQGIDALIDYVVGHNLTGILPQTLEHIERMVEKARAGNTLEIYSRFPLEPQEIAQVQQITSAVDARVVQHTDNSIIGGFSATHNGYVYDGSLKNQVTRLKSMLLQ